MMRDAMGANGPPPQPDVYTVAEAAALLGISEDAIYEDCRRGCFPHVKVGRRVLIPRRRFEAWLDGIPGGGPGVQSGPLQH
jgi:excisionase family DNA binding protein